MISNEPNWWCVDRKYKVYKDSKMLNDKGVMNRMLIVERQVLRESLCIVPAVYDLFTRH